MNLYCLNLKSIKNNEKIESYDFCGTRPEIIKLSRVIIR